MKPRVHHFLKSEAKILKTFSIQSSHYGHIAGVSNIVRDFLSSIKSGKPLKPRCHLHQEYPCTLNGVGKNFTASKDNTDGSLGTIRMVQVAQDENGNFYLRFETNQDFYYIPVK